MAVRDRGQPPVAPPPGLHRGGHERFIPQLPEPHLGTTGQWVGTAGQSSGSFTYSYPIDLPASLYDDAPGLALTYDSGQIDGKTSLG